MNKLLAVMFAAALSGALSGAVMNEKFITPIFGVQFGPGTFFGIIVAIALMIFYELRVVPATLLIAASIGGWFLALQLWFILNDQYSFVTFAASGGLGSLILALGITLGTLRLKLINIVITLTAGTIAAIPMWAIINHSDTSNTDLHMIIAFVIWQVCVALTLIRFVPVQLAKR
jgi:hypothetical protein